ncbi:DUF2382 domain-containing protein [Amycolatopsis sacchari]|uniref:DUF2382 domain-containing protein n=1 Tax=Amycolatopsis sacchari TaxID=115433 RepID=UPI003EBEB98C
MTSMLRPEELTEHAVVDPQGKKIGKVGTVYLSDETQEPEWVTVRTGMFGQKESFVPLRGARVDNDGLHVQVSKDQVTDAPRCEADQHLSEQESAELYRYYNLPTPRASMENRTGGQRDRMGRTRTGEAGEAVTRSEEQLRVGKDQVETGRVRLRKYTVTEEQQVRVPVTHEEVRVEREPMTGTERGEARIGEEEQEMTLHAERPRVEKDVVPMEQVRLRKENVTEEQPISGEVRKERIEIDDDADRKRRNR